MRISLTCLFALPALAVAQTKRIPPPGIEVPTPVREELQAGARELAFEIARLKKDFATDAKRRTEIPSVEIFHKAVDWALRYDEFFDAKQFAVARDQLAQGLQRAKDLRRGTPGWNEAVGLVVRGYRSLIDGSVQPYGLVVPSDWTPVDRKPRPLHLWFHGRAEKLSELAFIDERQHKEGEFVPPGAFVLHLYGRFCCANKFAGEVDAFEAMGAVAAHYPIDPQRVVVRGFSMGGASTWQFATHHPGRWAAAAPGAGFAETAEFFKVFAAGKPAVPWWEQVLWRWYDCTTLAGNLHGLPLIAYSGELDGQKQAADIMLRYAEKEGVTFPHVIGPQTAHKYHPDSKPKIEKFITEALAKGRDSLPRTVKFSTYSLIYPARDWVTIVGMEKHWERADVDAEIAGDLIKATTRNVAACRFILPASAFAAAAAPRAVVDGQELPLAKTGAGWSGAFRKDAGRWATESDAPQPGRNTKRPSLCGPIDHAFMSAFLHVRPTGTAAYPAVGAWVQGELEHATAQWRQVFRGEAPVKDDAAVTEEDVKNNHLVLWGDPASNRVLKKIADRLPVKWAGDKLEFRGYTLDAAHYAPVLIFPNPLNPAKYIVLNSGHTFRERAALNNSDQTPKLPDWAIIDVRVPADDRWPGLVYDAGFFDEQWR
jgi:hypothetical protein